MNKVMIEIVPEMNSEYAMIPMCNGKWHEPHEVLDGKVECFIPSKQQGPMIQDYIWMPRQGDLKAGYYHLWTQLEQAYIQIVHLMESRQKSQKRHPVFCVNTNRNQKKQSLKSWNC
jgi:hypothetical protein